MILDYCNVCYLIYVTVGAYPFPNKKKLCNHLVVL